MKSIIYIGKKGETEEDGKLIYPFGAGVALQLTTGANLVGHGDIRVTFHYASHTDNQNARKWVSG